MYYSKIKSKLHFQYIIILFLISFHYTSSSAIQNRFLDYYDYEDTNNYNEQKKETNETKTNFEEDPGTFLLAWFFIFFFMGLYIICVMKKYEETAKRTDDVWKFMFFANNGILVASFLNFLSFKNIFMDSSPFALSFIVFCIGCVYYLCKFSKNCNNRYAYEYFQYDKIREFFNLPCFILSLIGLTDPCCRSESYTVTTYADGHVESTECYMHCWNCFIYIFKRFAVIFSILSYYVFVIFYLIFWFIGKGIVTAVFNCRGITIEQIYPNVPNPEINPGIQQNIGNQVIINQNNANNIFQGIPNNNFQVSEKMFNNNIPNYDMNMQNKIHPLDQMANNGEISEQNRFQNNAQNFINNQSCELPDKTQLEEAINRQNQNIESPTQNNNNFNQEQIQQNNMNDINNDFNPNNNMGPGPIQ